MRERAGRDARWDLVAERINARLKDMRLAGDWSGKFRDLLQILGPHEHNIRRLRNGEPWNHDPAVLLRVSRGLGWAPDGIERLAMGDESGSEVVARPAEAPAGAAAASGDVSELAAMIEDIVREQREQRELIEDLIRKQERE